MRKERSIGAHARRQAGAFTRVQAEEAGFTRREIEYRLKEKVWRRSYPGVYCLRTVPESAEQRAWAALLWGADGSVLSHPSAAMRWHLDEVTAPTPELWLPARSKKRNPRITVHRGVVHDVDRRVVDGFRVTSPERTLFDLASVVDESALEIAFESARRMRLATIDSLRRCLERNAGRGRRGAAVLRRVVDQLGPRPSESALEVRTARLLRASKLPRPLQQFEIGRYRVDFAWPEQRVVLECDGKQRHSEDRDFQHDRTKLTAVATDGWRVLVVTHDDVTIRRELVLSQVQRALV